MDRRGFGLIELMIVVTIVLVIGLFVFLHNESASPAATQGTQAIEQAKELSNQSLEQAHTQQNNLEQVGP